MKKLFLFFIILSNLQISGMNNSFDKHLFSNDIKIVQEAISEGASINAHDDYGRTALINAALDNNLEVAKALIDSRACLNSVDDDGYTALISAGLNNSFEVAKLLIEAGADLNSQNESGYTALMLAACNGAIETAKLLINSGAHLFIKDNDGKTALMYALQSGKDSEIAGLLKNRIDEFIIAAQQGDIDKVKNMLSGIDINVQCELGFTALMRASQGVIDMDLKEKKLEILELLLAKGADFSLTDNVMHYTALRWAKEFNNKEAEKLLEMAETRVVSNF